MTRTGRQNGAQRRRKPTAGEAAHAASGPVRPTGDSEASTATSSLKSSIGRSSSTAPLASAHLRKRRRPAQPVGQRDLADLGARRVQQLEQRRGPNRSRSPAYGMLGEKRRAVAAGARPAIVETIETPQVDALGRLRSLEPLQPLGVDHGEHRKRQPRADTATQGEIDAAHERQPQTAPRRRAQSRA